LNSQRLAGSGVAPEAKCAKRTAEPGRFRRSLPSPGIASYNRAMADASRSASAPICKSSEETLPQQAGPRGILVLLNPKAGGGRGRRTGAAVANYFKRHGQRVEIVLSQSGGELERRAREAQAAGFRRVAVIGGDGALLHAVNGIFGSGVELGIIPAGQANDAANSLGIPRDPRAAADVVLGGQVRPVDLVRARFARGGTALYLGVGGAGFDAEAAQLANRYFRRLPGVTRYLAGALWSFRTFEPPDFEAELDGERVSGPLLFAAIANAPSYGAGLRIAPAAEMDDGWLDVTLVEPLGWTRLVRAIPILLRSGDIRWPEVRRHRARRVRLAANRPAAFHGDGEPLGMLPVELEVLPRALRVVVRELRG
jgi:diacylglycerol kinase (ATP)